MCNNSFKGIRGNISLSGRISVKWFSRLFRKSSAGVENFNARTDLDFIAELSLKTSKTLVAERINRLPNQ